MAGHATHFLNVCRVAQTRSHIRAILIPTTPYRADDRIERFLRFLPSSTRGTLRSTLATAPLFRTKPLDAVWSQVELPLLPWLLTSRLARQIPIVYSIDSTPRLLRQFGALYGYWGGRAAPKRWLREQLHGLCLRRAAVVLPWSEWAARSVQADYRVPRSRVRVLPPGVDLEFWHPSTNRPGASKRALRLLFVGGDFLRKGGDLLLGVYRHQLRGEVELDFVTRDFSLQEEPGVRVHTGLAPNDPRLLRLYQEADLFVLPTRADCFSLAGLEAMACGLPIVTCPIGGVAELIQPGRQGLFVPSNDGPALTQALRTLIADPARRRAMGSEARNLAVSRYDAKTNTAKVVDLLDQLSTGTAA